ncbi:hypothetical protein [Deinococcus multiflagellatus]|uniref:hypothetical protein n=1 Tax=Deinococcus multiflagellatus TaxID=1656887 RepID=UPI001CCB9241|nr:hypothetical protein [Deinococcus multiflagellatus]MBZ9713928.1 hypothetical protein [Deinococcus multiflagellatus]
MNREGELDKVGNSVGLFRDAFKSAVGRLVQREGRLIDVSREKLLTATTLEKKNLAWYFENDGVTEHDLELYDSVMIDYWERLERCLRAKEIEATVGSCLQTLFR